MCIRDRLGASRVRYRRRFQGSAENTDRRHKAFVLYFSNRLEPGQSSGKFALYIQPESLLLYSGRISELHFVRPVSHCQLENGHLFLDGHHSPFSGRCFRTYEISAQIYGFDIEGKL